jgi:lipoprotein NlpI
VQLAPTDPHTWMARGIFLLEWAEAFMTTQGLSADRAFNPPYLDFSKAIELDPKHTKAYVYRAITAAAWGKANTAKADMQKAFDLEPWDARKNLQFVQQTLAEMQEANRLGRQMLEEFAKGAEGRLPPVSSSDDGSAAARAKWNKETAQDNASKADDRGAYERIRRDEGTWRDHSLYGG